MIILLLGQQFLLLLEHPLQTKALDSVADSIFARSPCTYSLYFMLSTEFLITPLTLLENGTTLPLSTSSSKSLTIILILG